jgi:hypothetical protein
MVEHKFADTVINSPPSTFSWPGGYPSIFTPSKKWAALPHDSGSSYFFGKQFLCLHLPIHPLKQNLHLACDAIIIRPVVEVERTRVGKGVSICRKI